MTAPVVLAVDGGASKTDLVAVDIGGALVARATGAGTNPALVGWPAARARLDALRDTVLEQVGARPVLATHAYLAGLDLPPELVAARRHLAHWGDAVVDNDLPALLRAGTLAPDAAAVICGTGMNAIAVRADGATARFAAVGDISGDIGGGAWLGARALWHAARAADGRGPSTPLEQAVPQALGVADVEEAIAGLHLGPIHREEVTRLAPLLLAAAAAGDPPALADVLRQAEEVINMAVVALRRLGLLTTPAPVVLGGGVLAARPPVLVDAVMAGLAEQAPLARPTWVTARPVIGAALAALDSVGAPGSALVALHDVGEHAVGLPACP